MSSASFAAVKTALPVTSQRPSGDVQLRPTTAWGGTNLYSLNSAFIDVSGLAPDQFRTRVERIQVGARRSIEVEMRETPDGPVIADRLRGKGYDGPDVALRWVGHQPTR